MKSRFDPGDLPKRAKDRKRLSVSFMVGLFVSRIKKPSKRVVNI